MTEDENNDSLGGIKQNIEILQSELTSLLKKKAAKEQELKKMAYELKSKKDQLSISEGKLNGLKCELEMLNYYLSKERATVEKPQLPKVAAHQSINVEREADKSVIKELYKLEATVKAPVLNSLAGNYTTGFFQQNKMVCTFITVQKLDGPIQVLTDLDNYEGYAATFRISKTTNFHTLWNTACHYWGVPTGQYRLMDQNFNDLAGYEDTIENYIKVTKEPQKAKEALAYLVFYPQMPKEPHPLTQQVAKLGKKEQMEGKEFRIIRNKKIEDVDIVITKICGGLQKYKEFNKKAMDSFEDTTYLRRKPTYHIGAFILAVAFFV